MDAFLALERSGWKGEQGTALACSPKDERFFRQAAAGFHADGRLLMYGLWLDERPVALHAAFLDARTRAESAAFKIAYDEAYAKQSPGVLLEVWAIGEQHGPRPLAVRVDTCAWSGNPLWNELLLDRRELAHLMVGPRGPRRPGAGRGAEARPAAEGAGGQAPRPPGRLSPARRGLSTPRQQEAGHDGAAARPRGRRGRQQRQVLAVQHRRAAQDAVGA